MPAAERAARLQRAVDVLGIDGLLDRKPSQLSGGQQQRVALGRAIVGEAPVCLLDEPIALPCVASAFGIFLLRQTFRTVPRELEDAARVEGARALQVDRKSVV